MGVCKGCVAVTVRVAGSGFTRVEPGLTDAREGGVAGIGGGVRVGNVGAVDTEIGVDVAEVGVDVTEVGVDVTEVDKL